MSKNIYNDTFGFSSISSSSTNNVTTDNLDAGKENFIAVFTNNPKKIKPTNSFIDPTTNEILTSSYDTPVTTGINSGTYKINNEQVMSKYMDNLVVGDGFNYTATTSSDNTFIGDSVAQQVLSGVSDNVVVGYNSYSDNISNSIRNTIIGADSAVNMTSGDDNVLIGYGSGSNLTSGSSDNIYINNNGMALESNTIRIGKVGDQLSTYIQGIYNVTSSALILPEIVVVGQDGELGVASDIPFVRSDPTPVLLRSMVYYPDTSGEIIRDTNITTTVDENSINIPGDINLSGTNSNNRVFENSNQAISFFDSVQAQSTNVLVGVTTNNTNRGFSNVTIVGGNSSGLALTSLDNQNTIVGSNALRNTTSLTRRNTIVGYNSGINLTGGDRNMYLMSDGPTISGVESDTIRMGLPTFTNRVFITGIYNGTNDQTTPPLPTFTTSSGKVITKTSGKPYLTAAIAQSVGALPAPTIIAYPVAATGVAVSMDGTTPGLIFSYLDNDDRFDQNTYFTNPQPGRIQWTGPANQWARVSLNIVWYQSGGVMPLDDWRVTYAINGVNQPAFYYCTTFSRLDGPLQHNKFSWTTRLQTNEILHPTVVNFTNNDKTLQINTISFEIETIANYF